MKTLKNVIKGYNSKYGVEKLHIIDTADNSVCFSGNFDDWKNCDPLMRDFKTELENRIVLNQICHNFNTLFLFV